MSFSKRLKALRIQKHMTQQDVADAINVARTTVTGYETKNRQPSHEKLTAIAELFNVSIDFLIDPSDSTNEDFLILQHEMELDKDVRSLYSQLSYRSREDVLRYLSYLHFCEKQEQNNDTQKGYAK